MDWSVMFSTICDIVTLMAFGITLYQLLAVKKIAIQTQKELNRIDTIVDIGKCNEIIKDIPVFLKSQRIDHALSKLREVRDMIVRFKVYISKLDDSDPLNSQFLNKIDYQLEVFKNSINDIERKSLNPQSLNVTVLGGKFDDLSALIVEVQAHLSTKTKQ